MKLEEELEQRGYQATYVEHPQAGNKVYLDIDKKFTLYFAEYEKRCFLYVFINRPKDFEGDKKHTEEERQRCKEAKFKVLKLLNDEGITEIEKCESIENVLFSPQKGIRKRLEL
jgi:hypothetical protein